jgi:hypothetical protein
MLSERRATTMPRRDPAKERYWRWLLRHWQRSGLTGREFCVEQGISEANFYAWRRELARRDRQTMATKKLTAPLPRQSAEVTSSTSRPSSGAATPAFLKLALDAGAALPPAIEVVVAERRLLRVRSGFDADLLRQLLRLLEEPSC